jgi:hypothetical protein
MNKNNLCFFLGVRSTPMIFLFFICIYFIFDYLDTILEGIATGIHADNFCGRVLEATFGLYSQPPLKSAVFAFFTLSHSAAYPVFDDVYGLGCKF